MKKMMKSGGCSAKHGKYGKMQMGKKPMAERDPMMDRQMEKMGVGLQRPMFKR